nr:CDP-ethanolamine:1, 2-diacylglycerol ethanolaminephosphotransferase [Lobosphaera incisa]QZD35612.1 CDP-ethanolamine:1, 2-diacylglycerol ethanolaminephosphotransferase [Lobosphaera incisa]
MPYLSARALKGLKQYQYKPGGYTKLDDLHQPFWNWAVTLFPMWVAPNLITLTGIGGLVVAYLLTAVYSPELSGEMPRWVYFLNGFACLAYMHLDCLDGKQARRTKTSSPLGQLFDHGCDALSVQLIVTAIAASLDLGVSKIAVGGAMAILVPWILAHWEEYHTGNMLYGNGYWGLTEANYALVILHFATAAFGPHFWGTHLSSLVHMKLPIDVTVKESLLLAVSIFASMQVAGQLWRVLTRRHPPLPAPERGHKQLGSGHAASHLAQVVLILGLGAILMLEPASAHGQARVVVATYGLVYALEATKLIMDHMAKEPFEITWWPVALLVVYIINNRLLLVPAAPLAWIILAITMAGYVQYVTAVCGEICAYLGINCLTIRKADGVAGR